MIEPPEKSSDPYVRFGFAVISLALGDCLKHKADSLTGDPKAEKFLTEPGEKLELFLSAINIDVNMEWFNDGAKKLLSLPHAEAKSIVVSIQRKLERQHRNQTRRVP